MKRYFFIFLLSLFFVNVSVAVSTKGLSDSMEQWELAQVAVQGGPSDPKTQDARKTLAEINISSPYAQLELSRAFINDPISQSWVEEVLKAQAETSPLKHTPLSREVQVYLWDSLGDSNSVTSKWKHILKLLNFIPIYHIHIALERKLVKAVLNSNGTRPDLIKPAQILLRDPHLVITDNMLQQLQLIERVFRVYKGTVVPLAVTREIETILAGGIPLQLAQRLLVRWLSRPGVVQYFAERLLKSQDSLFSATQMDLWKQAQFLRKRNGENQSARRILRAGPPLKPEVRAKIKAVAQNLAILDKNVPAEVREKIKAVAQNSFYSRMLRQEAQLILEDNKESPCRSGF